MTSASDQRQVLQANIHRWLAELAVPDVAATLLEGMAGKAVNSFDELLRSYLNRYLVTCGISWSGDLSQVANGKTLANVTLGEAIGLFRHLDRRLTTCVRARGFPKGRRLFTSAAKLLDEVNRLRKLLIHNRSGFARDYRTLRQNTEDLLCRLDTALNDTLFTFADGIGV